MTKRASALRKPEKTEMPKDTPRSAAKLESLVHEVLRSARIDPETRLAWLALEMNGGEMTQTELQRRVGVDAFTVEIDLRNHGLIERRNDGLVKLADKSAGGKK